MTCYRVFRVRDRLCCILLGVFGNWQQKKKKKTENECCGDERSDGRKKNKERICKKQYWGSVDREMNLKTLTNFLDYFFNYSN